LLLFTNTNSHFFRSSSALCFPVPNEKNKVSEENEEKLCRCLPRAQYRFFLFMKKLYSLFICFCYWAKSFVPFIIHSCHLCCGKTWFKNLFSFIFHEQIFIFISSLARTKKLQIHFKFISYFPIAFVATTIFVCLSLCIQGMCNDDLNMIWWKLFLTLLHTQHLVSYYAQIVPANAPKITNNFRMTHYMLSSNCNVCVRNNWRQICEHVCKRDSNEEEVKLFIISITAVVNDEENVLQWYEEKNERKKRFMFNGNKHRI
jgi:hypothetical protein